MTWQFYNDRACFNDLRKDWDALNKDRGNHILLDSRFVAPLVRHFGTDDTVLAVNKSGARKGLVFLVKSAAGVWCTFQPSQSPLGMILFAYQDEGHEGLIELMRSLPSYAVLLSILQQDPLYSSFPYAATRSNIETLNYMDTPRLQLSGTFEEYWQQRGKNLRHNLERQKRRLREQGRSLELVVEQSANNIAECIREYGRIESAGWKAEGGTAIHESNVQGRFYRDVFEDFASTQETLIFQLRLDGKVIASDLCLFRDGTLIILKTTYDESVEKLSPALLMRHEIIQWLYLSGKVRTVEFYGPVRNWHTQWTSETRTMFHVNLFRNLYVVGARKILKRFR